MLNKLIITLLFCSSTLLAQNNYSSTNYTAWKIIDVNVKDKYAVVTPIQKTNMDLFMPICYSGDTMIFKYEMMGMDDSFYDKGSQAKSLKTITNSRYVGRDYSLKIDVEEDNNIDGKLDNEYNKICAANNAQKYNPNQTNKGNSHQHGVIKYIGDITIRPPF